MKIETEKFNIVKGLATIDIGVSSIGVVLGELSKATDQYIKTVGNKANNKIKEVLIESRDVLEETVKNHDELISYGKDLNIYAKELRAFTDTVRFLSNSLNKEIEKSEKDMKDHYGSISDLKKEIKIESVNISENRKLLKIEREETEEQTRLLVDRRKTLDRGFKELKKLKENKIK